MMRKLIRKLTVLATLALATPVLAQTERLYSTPIASSWQGEATKGELIYKPIALSFPDTLGKFERRRVGGFEGIADFWVNYGLKRPAGDTTMTLFFFQPRSSMAEHTISGSLSSLNSALGADNPTFVWADGPRLLKSGDRELRFFKGTYKTGIGPGTIMDYIYFADLGNWRVKVRVTMPSPDSVELEQSVERAIEAIDWKAVMAANGACTGPACDTTSVVPFNHHIGEMFLSQVVNSGQGNKLSGDAAKPLFERKVDGTNWTVWPLDAKLGELFAGAYGALSISGTSYSLSWEKGGKKGMVRFFSGLPSEAQFNHEVDELSKRPETTVFVPLRDAIFYAAE